MPIAGFVSPKTASPMPVACCAVTSALPTVQVSASTNSAVQLVALACCACTVPTAGFVSPNIAEAVIKACLACEELDAVYGTGYSALPVATACLA